MFPKRKDRSWSESGNKGIFVGYSDQSKAYKFYIPGFRKIEVSRDVTFDEDTTFNKSRKTHVDEEEQETPRVVEISKLPAIAEDYHVLKVQDMVEPQDTIGTPHETISTRKILAWACDIIQEA